MGDRALDRGRGRRGRRRRSRSARAGSLRGLSSCACRPAAVAADGDAPAAPTARPASRRVGSCATAAVRCSRSSCRSVAPYVACVTLVRHARSARRRVAPPGAIAPRAAASPGRCGTTRDRQRVQRLQELAASRPGRTSGRSPRCTGKSAIRLASSKLRHVEQRVVRLRQPVQRQHAEHRRERAHRIVISKVIDDERRPTVVRPAADVHRVVRRRSYQYCMHEPAERPDDPADEHDQRQARRCEARSPRTGRGPGTGVYASMRR